MGNIYIAINGDDVGNRIGEAIANDDHEGLAQASSSIQSAHDNIDQWVDSIGGKKISSAGDDAIYLVPEQAVNDLDGVREQYKQESGHGLTVGVGPSMSQASKALIYGKLNGKDQTIHYEPGIEDYLSEDGEQGEEEQPEVPEQADVQGQADADMEAEEGTGDLEEPPVDEQASQDNEVAPAPDTQPGKKAPQPGKKAPPPTTDQSQLDSQPEVGNEDDVAEDDQNQTDAPGNPVANETSAQKQASKPVGGIKPPIDGKSDEDLGTGEEDDASAPPAADQGDDGDMSEDHPGQPADPDADDDNVENANPDPASELQAGQAPQDPDADQESEDPDADSGMDMSTTEGDVDGDSAYQDISDDDAAQDDDQAPGDEDPLASMIHGDMQEGGDDSSLDDELRQDIASALVSFKENKDMLEQAREQNPELYNATLTMLRSMIAMAKKLGFAPEQDMADQSNVQQLEEEFPGANPDAQADEDGQMEDDASVDGDSDQESDGTDESPAEKKGAIPPAKK